MDAQEQAVSDDVAALCARYTLFEWSPRQAGLDAPAVQTGEGLYFTDASGRRYLDFSSQYMNLLLGHRPPAVLDAVRAQLDELPYIMGSFSHRSRGLFGEALARIAPPGLVKSFLTIGGAEAIESAVKIARAYTGRSKILTRYQSFHGATYGALSLSGDRRRLSHESSYTDRVVRVEDPYCYRCPWNQRLESCARECVQHVERVIEFEGPDSIAAVLLEGATAGSGCHTYPPDYWDRIGALCARYGILLISDEIVSFARTGRWFATDYYHHSPDIVVLAKGISGGVIPFGAVIVGAAISEFFDDHPVDIGLTANSHPLGCAAGLAVIRDIETHGRLQHVQQLVPILQSLTTEVRERHPSVGDVRFTGLLGCFELVADPDLQSRLDPAVASTALQRIRTALARSGVFTLLRPGLVFFAPPITAEARDLDIGFSAIDDALFAVDQLVA